MWLGDRSGREGELSTEELEVCLDMSLRTPLSKIDPSLEELVQLISVRWSLLVPHLQAIYQGQLRVSDFNRNASSGKNLVIVSPEVKVGTRVVGHRSFLLCVLCSYNRLGAFLAGPGG